MGFIIYYFTTMMLNMVCYFTFNEHLHISYESLLPLVLGGLSVFQSVYFHTHRMKKDFNINNDSELTEDEWAVLAVYIRNSYMLSIPLYIPFILFFSAWVKIFSVLIYLFSLGAGPF